jgi:hypothetical protein
MNQSSTQDKTSISIWDKDFPINRPLSISVSNIWPYDTVFLNTYVGRLQIRNSKSQWDKLAIYVRDNDWEYKVLSLVPSGIDIAVWKTYSFPIVAPDWVTQLTFNTWKIEWIEYIKDARRYLSNTATIWNMIRDNIRKGTI